MEVPVQVEMELDLFLGNGNVCCAGLTNAGLHDSVVIDVLNLAPSPLLYWWSSCTCPCGGFWSRCLPGAWWVFSCTWYPPRPWLVFGPLGKAPAPKGSKSPPTTRAAGFTSPAPGFKPPPPGAGVGFPPPGPSLAPPRASRARVRLTGYESWWTSLTCPSPWKLQ